MKKMKFIISIIFLFIFTTTSRATSLDDYLNQLYKSHVIPGFSVVVVQNENIIFEKGFGKEYIDGSIPMTSLTSSAIGSLAKSFTAMAMMQLVEKGRVVLDEPVITYIPWFRTANKEVSDKITVRMLLNNTSGLKAPNVRNKDISEKAAESLVRSMGSVYLTTEPGEAYEYSNDGFALAGLIISRVSGMTYEKYLEENIFKPLQMNRTTNDTDKFENLKVVFGHYSGINKAIRVKNDDNILGEYVAAGSVLRSSASDIGNYLKTLINEGKFSGQQILSQKSIKEMWKPYSSFPGISIEDGGENLPISYGLGWFIGEVEGKKYIFHGGNRRNMSSMTILFPEENIAASFIANFNLTFIDNYKYPNLINITNNIIRIALGECVSDYAISRVPDPTVNNFRISKNLKNKYVGKYLLTQGNDWVYLGSELFIAEENEKLVATISKGTQLIEQFEVDFISQKTAFSRNLSIPRKIYFKFLNNGEISDLFFAGLKYSKLSEGYYNRFKNVESVDKSLSFYFPKNWSIKWDGINFTGNSFSSDRFEIKGYLFSEEKTMENYFKELYPGQQVIHTGQEATEISGNHFWNEIAIVSETEKGKKSHFLCKTKNGNQYYVFIISAEENLTAAMNEAVPTLLSTFLWKL